MAAVLPPARTKSIKDKVLYPSRVPNQYIYHILHFYFKWKIHKFLKLYGKSMLKILILKIEMQKCLFAKHILAHCHACKIGFKKLLILGSFVCSRQLFLNQSLSKSFMIQYVPKSVTLTVSENIPKPQNKFWNFFNCTDTPNPWPKHM